MFPAASTPRCASPIPTKICPTPGSSKSGAAGRASASASVRWNPARFVSSPPSSSNNNARCETNVVYWLQAKRSANSSVTPSPACVRVTR